MNKMGPVAIVNVLLTFFTFRTIRGKFLTNR